MKEEKIDIGKIYNEVICPACPDPAYFDFSWDEEDNEEEASRSDVNGNSNGAKGKYGIDIYAKNISNSSSVVFTFCGKNQYKIEGELAVAEKNVDRCKNILKRYGYRLTDIHKHYGNVKHLHFKGKMGNEQAIRNFLDSVRKFVHY
jgi:hypothetical protein